MKETTFYICMMGLCVVGTLAGVVTGKGIGKESATKDFVAQCQKSQLPCESAGRANFADGVGIQCPAVINNRVTKEQ